MVSILVTESLSGALRVGTLNTGTVVFPTAIRVGSALADRAGGGGPGGGGGSGMPGPQFTDGNCTVCGDGPAEAARRAVGGSKRGSVGVMCTEARWVALLRNSTTNVRRDCNSDNPLTIAMNRH